MDFVDTTELQGERLDYWVAYAERENGHASADTISTPPPPFSSDSALADPIIEREGIYTVFAVDAEFGNKYVAGFKPEGRYGFPRSEHGVCMGDGPLEAALRFYVHHTLSRATSQG